MKITKVIVILSVLTIFITTTYAAEVPRESAPCNAKNEAIIVVESFIGDILTEVQNGMGYADARAKSNRIFFNAWLNGQTNGYSYGELVDIANAAICNIVICTCDLIFTQIILKESELLLLL